MYSLIGQMSWLDRFGLRLTEKWETETSINRYECQNKIVSTCET